MFEAEVSPLMQKVMERHPDVYLKAYVCTPKSGRKILCPLTLVSTSTDKADAETQLQAATYYFQELVVEAGKFLILPF